jgi:hypothetical protein
VGVGVGAFLLTGGDVPIVGGGGGPTEFDFDLKKVKALPVSETAASDLRDAAQEAGDAVKATMDELYFSAFVDAGSWGDYGAVYELFDPVAAARAESDTDILTLGGTANEDYEALEPSLGTLSVVVLTDRKDVPVRALAEVRFAADAEMEDGSTTTISSVGSFFLRAVEGEWRIFGYRVDRDEEAARTPSPTEEAS